MNKFLTYLGGLIGGFSLIEIPVGGTILSGLDPLLDIIGALSVIVFAGAFVVHGVRSWFVKS